SPVLRAKSVDNLGKFQPERFAVHPSARKRFLIGKIIKRLGDLEPVDFNPMIHSRVSQTDLYGFDHFLSKPSIEANRSRSRFLFGSKDFQEDRSQSHRVRKSRSGTRPERLSWPSLGGVWLSAILELKTKLPDQCSISEEILGRRPCSGLQLA